MSSPAPTLSSDDAALSHPDVHIGTDGWLFLVGGSNAVLTQYREPGVARADLWRWRRILEARTFRCARLGARYVHVVAPEKLAIYDHALGDLALDAGRAPALRLERWLTASIARRAWIDLVRPFRAGSEGAALYRRTDTHWTFDGCYLAYREICRRLGVAPRDDIASRRTGVETTFSGDLGLKFTPPLTERAEPCLFESEARRIYANDLVTTFEAMGRGRDAHIGAHVVFRNPSPQADPRTLVLFGDSYAHHTPNPCTGTLTPMLADTFREVHLLWSTSVDWGYVARVRPHFVVSEIAERFLVDVPQTGFTIEKLSALALARKTA
ncbi:hypothetical protein G3T14_08045 [Methylobacterium sp. BTF04]|uniref:alginate O-acetyltransferase AlgX-related protein n=1 Tax=Methylobacterium sp. BTF04 TaxID=2708300 RepID=UPI0013D2E602|nr:hypothetical protein [Methylobacterium sp. BTF04]NEU12081.1 hypothetical protein [Methylobacterium sp. BTF04]